MELESASSRSSGHSSKISVKQMELTVQKLLGQQNRTSTIRTYRNIWKQFNEFLLRLDNMHPTWEHRTTLYIAYLVEQGKQSSSVKSYVSAIKKFLIMDGYDWKDNEVLLSSMTKACRIINDRVRTRLAINCSLLEMILFEVGRLYSEQPYLEYMYKAIFAMSYYGMMRVGEVTYSPHVLKAKNVHIGTYKDKLLLVLYSSKTHDKGSRLQKIKITSNRAEKMGLYVHRNFCPFKIMRVYLQLRGNYKTDQEQFFIFRDGQPIRGRNVGLLLKKLIQIIGLQDRLYSMHSFRIGRTSDLVKFNYPIDEVKRLGRWKSNAVFKYIRN